MEQVTHRYDKLIRWGIVDEIEGRADEEITGAEVAGMELAKALIAKIIEEATELDPADPKVAAELADLSDALANLVAVLGVDPAEIEKAQAEKIAKWGELRRDGKGYLAGSVTLAADDPWAAYLAAHPDRYPEIPTETATS